MKIAFFTQNLGNYISGGRQYSWHIAHCLASKGHKVNIFTNVKPLFDREYEKFPGRENISIYEDLWYGSKTKLPLIRECDLYIGTPTESVDYAVALAGINGKKCIGIIFEPLNQIAEAQDNGIEINVNLNDSVWSDFTKQIHKTNMIICNSQLGVSKTREWMPKYTGDVEYLYNSFNVDIAKKCKYIEPKDREYAIAYCSRTEMYKGYGDILYYLGNMPKKPKVYYISGFIDKNNRKHSGFFKACQDAKIDLIIKNRISEQEKFDIISKVKFLFHPSRFEGFGLPIAEAFYCKTPVVCYDLPVFREIFKEYPHYIPLGELDTGISLFDELLNTENSDELLFRQIDEVQKYISSFAEIESFANKLDDLLNKVQKKTLVQKPNNPIQVNLDFSIITIGGDVNGLDKQNLKSFNLVNVKSTTDLNLDDFDLDRFKDDIILCRSGIDLNDKALHNLLLKAKSSDADLCYGLYEIDGKKVNLPDFVSEQNLVRPGLIYGMIYIKKELLRIFLNKDINELWELDLAVAMRRGVKWVNCYQCLFKTKNNVYFDVDLTSELKTLLPENYEIKRMKDNFYDLKLPYTDYSHLVVIPARTFKYFKDCYESVLTNKSENREVVVCHHIPDGNWNKDLLDYCKSQKLKVMKFKDSFNYSKMNNQIIDRFYKDQKYIILLNDDTILYPDAISNLLATFDYPEFEDDIGIVGSKLLYPKKDKNELSLEWTDPSYRIQHCGVVLLKDHMCSHVNRGYPSNKLSANIMRSFPAVTFAFVAISSECYFKTILDEKMTNEFNDIDFCLRAKRNGFSSIYNPKSVALHLESITRREFKLNINSSDRKLFETRYKDLISKHITFAEMQMLERLGW